MDTGGAEEQRVHISKRVPGIEAPVVDYSGGYDLLSQLQLSAQALDEVGEEDVDLVEVLHVIV